MKKNYKELKILYIIIGIIIFIFILAVGVLLFNLWKNDNGEPNAKITFTLIVVLSVLFAAGLIVVALCANSGLFKSNLSYEKDKNVHNDFNLKLYSIKNGRYIHKVLFSARHHIVDYRDYDEKFFHNYPISVFEEIYANVDVDERLDIILDIIDSRVIDKALFFETKTDYGWAYSYIDTELKTYSVIVFNGEEVKRRDEVNNDKKRLVLENDRIIEEMDKILNEIQEKGRIYKETYSEDLSIRDIVLKIKDILDKY